MKRDLKEIDRLCREIAEYYPEPDANELLKLSEVELVEYMQKRKNARKIYNEIIRMLDQIKGNLTDDDVIDAYNTGAPLMKELMSGYINLQVSEKFIRTMLEAIRNDDRPAYRFLVSLATIDYEHFREILIEALDSHFVRTLDNALAYVGQHLVIEALPQVVQLEKNDNPQIARLASQVRQKLEAASH